VNIFKAEIDYDIGPVHLGNQFRYEDYRTVTTRFDQDRNLDAATSKSVTVAERYDHDALYNTFHAESHLSEKVYWSVGYLFTTLEGDASFRMFTTPFSDPFDKNWFTDSVDVDQDSHVVNVNAMVGPFKHVTLYGGFQTEITETDGDTDAVLTEIPFGGPPAVSPHAVIVTRTDKTDFEETVGVRYAGIPYTALYAEGRWTQGSIDQFERELEDGALAFERATDTGVERQRYTAGFNTSPIRRVTLSGRYRHTRRNNDYDHDRDTEPGYSAFITEQALTTDQVSTKLTVRPIAGIKTSVQYQFVATDIDTEADTTPPSSVTSGEYRAHVYTANVTVTPIARLYLTGLFSYRDTRTSAFDNGVPSITTYDGDVYTFIAAAGYVVDDETDLNIEYLFTYSDNFDDNSSSGLPLGLDHERHGLLAKLSRRITKNIEAWLRYGFYAYDEDSNGGVDDYTAHLIGAGLGLAF